MARRVLPFAVVLSVVSLLFVIVNGRNSAVRSNVTVTSSVSNSHISRKMDVVPAVKKSRTLRNGAEKYTYNPTPKSGTKDYGDTYHPTEEPSEKKAPRTLKGEGETHNPTPKSGTKDFGDTYHPTQEPSEKKRMLKHHHKGDGETHNPTPKSGTKDYGDTYHPTEKNLRKLKINQ